MPDNTPTRNWSHRLQWDVRSCRISVIVVVVMGVVTATTAIASVVVATAATTTAEVIMIVTAAVGRLSSCESVMETIFSCGGFSGGGGRASVGLELLKPL